MAISELSQYRKRSYMESHTYIRMLRTFQTCNKKLISTAMLCDC